MPIIITEEWRKYSNVVRTKERWMPVTNTHAKYPDKGVLALKFWNYSLAGNGCEGLTGGTATITVSVLEYTSCDSKF